MWFSKSILSELQHHTPITWRSFFESYVGFIAKCLAYTHWRLRDFDTCWVHVTPWAVDRYRAFFVGDIFARCSARNGDGDVCFVFLCSINNYNNLNVHITMDDSNEGWNDNYIFFLNVFKNYWQNGFVPKSVIPRFWCEEGGWNCNFHISGFSTSLRLIIFIECIAFTNIQLVKYANNWNKFALTITTHGKYPNTSQLKSATISANYTWTYFEFLNIYSYKIKNTFTKITNT